MQRVAGARCPSRIEPTSRFRLFRAAAEVARRSVRRHGPLAAALGSVVVLLVPYLGFLGSHQLWPPYEPELVETAREMRASGDLIVPRLNGKIFADKPPLYYWGALTAASARGRLDEIAARLPSALSSLLLVFVTALFGARIFGARAGLLAGLIVGTMPLCIQCGTTGMCDMPLALTVTASLLLVHVATCEGEARGWALALAALVLGVSVMAKSLLGPALVFLGAVPAIVLDKERRLPRLRWWVLSGVAFLAVTVPWFVAVGYSQGRSFLFEVLVHQTFDRFLGRGDSKGMLLNYLGTLPLDVLPWTIFLPLAALHAWRARSGDPGRWRKLRFLSLGFGLELAFLSASACRINKYALPLLPQLALLIGAALDAEGDRVATRLARVPAIALAAAGGVVAVVVPLVLVNHFPSLATLATEALVLGLLGALGLYVLARTAGPPAIAFGLVAIMIVGAVFMQDRVYRAIDEIRTDAPLEGIIVKNVGPETPYASYGIGTRSYIIFYTERTYREFYSRQELDGWLASLGPRTAYVLTRDDYLKQLAADPLLAARLEVVGRNPSGVGHDDYPLVRVRPR
jgi:4-amino-4-deoxy-L-arabinose transferase-like glycosyltransferase